MAEKQERHWDIDEILKLGTNLIGDTIRHMNEVLPEERDGTYAKSLAGFMRAACEIAKDQREAAAFMAKQQIDPEVMHGLIQDYLRSMPKEEFVAMVATVRKEQQQDGVTA